MQPYLNMNACALRLHVVVVQVGLAVVRCALALRQRRGVVWFWWSVHRRGLPCSFLFYYRLYRWSSFFVLHLD
nr:MAG TPA: hypothetical protein [Caudoviricetes sp.]